MFRCFPRVLVFETRLKGALDVVRADVGSAAQGGVQQVGGIDAAGEAEDKIGRAHV